MAGTSPANHKHVCRSTWKMLLVVGLAEQSAGESRLAQRLHDVVRGAGLLMQRLGVRNEHLGGADGFLDILAAEAVESGLRIMPVKFYPQERHIRAGLLGEFDQPHLVVAETGERGRLAAVCLGRKQEQR